MIVVGRVLALVALAFAGCATTDGLIPHLDPPLYLEPTALAAWADAYEASVELGGELYFVADTHSMEPTLWGGDYIVVVPVRFADLKVGQIITYRADWLPADSPYVTHRIVLIDRDGLLMEGDNNPNAETGYRVTDATDRGLMAGIWRAKPSTP